MFPFIISIMGIFILYGGTLQGILGKKNSKTAGPGELCFMDAQSSVLRQEGLLRPAQLCLHDTALFGYSSRAELAWTFFAPPLPFPGLNVPGLSQESCQPHWSG